ncbi:MAG: hypothetical protein ABJZ55_08850 [Fuerstiella sp.]
MKNERINLAMIVIAGCSIVSGCTALSSDGTTLSKAATEASGAPQVSPAFRAQNHRQWVMRLTIAKPIEGLEGRAAVQAATTSLPIPLPPSSIDQYALVVDQQQQLAWLKGSNQYGPFPLANPDVTHLMNSVAAAYHEQAAWQAAYQEAVYQQSATTQQPVTQQAVMQQAVMQQASIPPEFRTAQPSNTASFGEFSSKKNVAEPEWESPVVPPVKSSSYAKEFDEL